MVKIEESHILRVESLQGWIDWLEKNHDRESVVWLVYTKKGAGAPVPFEYQETLEEALCWGWIDSLLKSINDKEYMRKFNPRKPNSTWSEKNKKSVAILKAQGRMKAPGLRAVEVARKNGRWEAGVKRPEVDDSLPAALLSAFRQRSGARDCYFSLRSRQQKQFNIWINLARRPETVNKRVEEALEKLERGEELGLK